MNHPDEATLHERRALDRLERIQDRAIRRIGHAGVSLDEVEVIAVRLVTANSAAAVIANRVLSRIQLAEIEREREVLAVALKADEDARIDAGCQA
jgi:hypothetical protein